MVWAVGDLCPRCSRPLQAARTRLGAAQPDQHADRDGGHAAAVARSLRWADEAAGRADWADALAWIAVVEAGGDTLPDEFRAKRERWLAARGGKRESREQASPPDRAG